MSAINDGGPAFPMPGFLSMMEEPQSVIQQYENKPQDGMTLRDWFAGMALPACFSAPCPAAWAAGSMEHREQSAAASYMMADAMLAARERKEDA